MLSAWSSGETRNQDQLFELIYPEIRHLVRRRWRHAGAELQTTELISEAYLRLAEQRVGRWRSRAHFFAIAATAIRRVMVDEARRRGRRKRGADRMHLPIETVDPAAPEPAVDLLALETALRALADVRASAARIVELRYFGGLSIDDTAEVLGVGRTTVIRQWRFARAWLSRRLAEPTR